jgi:HAMP domain-containing protein
MNAGNRRRLKNYFIKKRLQTNFILKFCLLVILACAIMSALVYLLSEKTTTTSFEGLRLTVKSTADFILPTLILSSLVAIILISLATVAVFLLITHRIAGPLHRLETDLAEIAKGDLTKDIHLRKKDEFKILAAIINSLLRNLRNPISVSRTRLNELESDIAALKAGLRAKGTSEDEAEQIVRPLRKKAEQIKNIFLFFKISSIVIFFAFMSCLPAAQADVTDGVPPAELISNEGWTITKSIFCTLYFRYDVDIGAVNDRLDTYKVDYGLLEKPPRPGEGDKEKISYKFDLIFYKVQELLDMRPKDLHLNVRIYRDQKDLDRVYMEIFDQENKFIAYYIFKINTLFASEAKISANVMAHEIAHCIVDHYFSVIPPKKVAEMIAQYADAHLRD